MHTTQPVHQGAGQSQDKGKRRAVLVARHVVLFVILLGALGVMLFPLGQRLWFSYQSQLAVERYAQVVGASSSEELERVWQAALAYNEGHTVNEIVDPFAGDEGTQLLNEEYMAQLNPAGDGVMGYVDIPKIDQRLNLYHGTDAPALQKGVGHLQGTSLPVGGAGSHCVISGHRGLPNAKVFTDLDQLVPGDVVYLCILDRVLAYQVDGTQEVLPSEVGGLDIVPGEDLLTLVTCTPYAVNTHRLLVQGHRVPVTVRDGLEGDGHSMYVRVRLVLFAVATLVALAVGFTLTGRTILGKRRTRKRQGGATPH